MIDKSSLEQFDNNILIEGNRGLGKSTLAVKVANRSKVYPFKPRQDLIYKRAEIIQAIVTRIRKSIIADELINAGYKRDFYEQGQKKLIKALNMYRDSFNLFIGCIPNFVDLDNDLRELCKLRLTVLRRGFALVHLPLQSIYTRDKWDIKNNTKIEAGWSLKKNQKPAYHKLTTCVGYVVYGDISPQARVIYEAIKKEKRGQIYNPDGSLEFVDPEKLFYDNLLKSAKAKRLTPELLKEICLIQNKKYKTVRVRLNTMLDEEGVKDTLSKLVTPNNYTVEKDTLGFALPSEND